MSGVISEKLNVLCPFEQTTQAARSYLDSLPVIDGQSVVALRVTIGDLTVERQADLTLNHVRAIPGFEIMNLGWKPHDGGLYPHFYGTLTVEDMGGNYSRLDLSGSYKHPLGLAGATFDAIAGNRIALAVARQLLDDIRIGLEFAFQTGRSVA